MTSVLSVERLSFQRAQEKTLFRDVTFSVGEGQICGIIGPSGIGKSTLLRLVSGLAEDDEIPAAGRIRLFIDREEHSPYEALRHGLIGVALQDPMLFPWLSVKANSLWVTRVRRGREAAREALAEALLARFGLRNVIHQRSSTLSDGQKQRVALIRALLSTERLLVLDEPFSSLDILTKYHLTYHVRQMIRASGWGGIVVAHDERDIARICDVVYVLRNEGRNGPADIARLEGPVVITLGDRDRWEQEPESRAVPENGHAGSDDEIFYSEALNGTVNSLVSYLVSGPR